MDKQTIKILSHDVNILAESPGMWSEGGMGHCSIKAGEIGINDSMPPDSMASTIIHEVCHYVSDLLSLEMSESQVDGIAVGIFSLLRDNKAFVDEILRR